MSFRRATNLFKKAFCEKNLVVILFVMVLITFSLAQQDSKKLEKMYMGFKIQQSSPPNTATRMNVAVQHGSASQIDKYLQAN